MLCQRINVKPLEIPFKGAKSPVQVNAKKWKYIKWQFDFVPFWDLAGILLLIYTFFCETPFKKMLAAFHKKVVRTLQFHFNPDLVSKCILKMILFTIH